MKHKLGLVVLLVTASVLLMGATPPDGHTRASWRMLRYLVKLTETMRGQEMLKDRFAPNGCPADIMWITFGISKTDAWGRPLRMKCNAETGFKPHYLSAGADGKFGTGDDLDSEVPLYTAEQVCPLLCRNQKAGCDAKCRKMDMDARFAAETCLALAGHEHVELATCRAALPERGSGWVECPTFARAAVEIPGASRAKRKAVEKACEQDIVWPPELLCVIESRTLTEARYCTQTLPQSWIESAQP